MRPFWAVLGGFTVLGGLAVLAASCGSDGTAAGIDEPWQQQLGSAEGETSFSVDITPDGDVVVTGSTKGDLAGTNAGERDVYLARFSPTGEQRWSSQIGGPANDSPLGVAAAPDGSLYLAGFTDGSFAGDHQGSADIWLARLTADGDVEWKQQFGGPAWDRGFDVVAFDGGAYVTGYADSELDADTDRGQFDGFAARFTDTGDLTWVTQFGSDATDWGQGGALAPDGGLYVTGYTEGALDGGESAGGRDAFIIRLTPDGAVAWQRQFGSPGDDWPQGIATGPDGSVAIAGSTDGDLAGPNQGEQDAFIAHYSASGDQVFVQQFGTAATDSAFQVRFVGDGLVASGSTAGALAEAAGDRDGFIAWFDADGTRTETRQIGSAAVDDITGLAVSPAGDIFYSGSTFGAMGGPNQGAADIVLGAVPPPGPAEG